MKFIALLIATVSAVTIQRDVRQADGPASASDQTPQRMSGVNGSVNKIPTKHQRWLDVGTLTVNNSGTNNLEESTAAATAAAF